jgi:sugar phosphate isomerase/epimerase
MNAHISVWSGYFGDLSPEEAVDELVAAGFSCAEFSIEHGIQLLERPGTPLEKGKALKEYAAQRGLAFLQGHLDLDLDMILDNDALKDWLDLFWGLGIKAAVLHATGAKKAPHQEQLALRAEALKKLQSHIAGRDMTICLENLFSNTMVNTADGILELIHAAGDTQLGVCLDIGHLHRVRCHGKTNQTIREFITKAGSRLKALHIHTNNGDLDDHLLPYSGMNGLDWKEAMAALREVDYQGLFNMELNGEAKAPLAVRRMKLRYARELAQYLLSDGFLAE